MRILGILVRGGALLFGLSMPGQFHAQIPSVPTVAQPAAPATELLSFEVATIKLNRSGDQGFAVRMPLGRFTTTGTTTKFLIAYAYSLKDYQVTGGPGWVDSERYDVDAKVPDSITEKAFKVPFEQIRGEYLSMVQTLLADRFNLRVSHQPKDLPVYALVVAKNGPKVLKAKPANTYPDGIKGRDGHAIGRTWRMSRGQLIVQGQSMDSFVGVLSQYLGRTVLNQTGLMGDYDFTLQWTPEPDESTMFSAPEPGQSALNSPSPPDSSGPSIFTAMPEELGLKLESKKGPVPILVIEQIERPSEN